MEMVKRGSKLSPSLFRPDYFRRPAGDPAGPNFAPKPPYAKFLLTLAHMPDFCSLPENPLGRPLGHPSGAHMRVVFFESLIFKKIFGIILKKSICAVQHTKKNSRSDVRTGLPQFSQPLLFYFYDGNPGASILIKKWFSRQFVRKNFLEA